MEKHVETLIEKAAKSMNSDDALKFSQAACNAANALCALATSKRVAKYSSAAPGPFRIDKNERKTT